MTKSKKQLNAELAALKEELPLRQTIAGLLYTEGFQLAIDDYKQRMSDAVQAEDAKNISAYKKDLDVLFKFKSFLKTQEERAEQIPELISDIEYDLRQGDLFA